jgi:hypothetical protein
MPTEQDTIRALRIARENPDKPEVIAKAKAVADAYKRQQEAAGKPLWPETERAKVEDAAKMRAMFQDRERHGFDEGTFSEFSTTFPDPEKKARFLNSQFLARVFNRSTDEIRSLGTQYRDEYAKQTWGEPVKTEGEFFEKLAGDFDFEDEIGKRAATAALTGSRNVDALAKLSEEFGTDPRFSSRSKQWKDLFFANSSTIRAKVAPYQTRVASIVESLREKTGLEDGTGETPSYRELAENLLEVPEDDRALVISAIINRGTNGDEAARKGYAQKLAENFGRGVQDLAAGVDFADRGQGFLVRNAISEGVTVPAEKTGSPEAYLQAVKERIAGGDAFELGAGMLSAVGAKELAAPSDETKAAALDLAEKALQGIDLRAELRRIAENDIDPATSSNVIARGFLAAARSAPFTLAARAPGGFAVNTAAFAETNYQTLRANNPGLSPEAASTIAGVTAPLQSFIERSSAGLATAKLPALNRFFNQVVLTRGGVAGRFAARGAATAAAEMFQENLQDLAPSLTQGVFSALSEDVPGVDWSARFGDMGKNQGELFFAVLPLALMGAGVGTARDFGAAKSMLGNYDMLRAVGLTEAAASEVRAKAISGDVTGAQDLLRAEFRDSGADQVAIQQAQADAIPRLIEQREKVRELVNRAGDIDLLPAIRNNGEGSWSLEYNDGSGVSFQSYEEADARRWQVAADENLALHEDTRETIRRIDSDLDAGRELKYLFALDAPTLADAQERGDVTEEDAAQRLEIADTTTPELDAEFEAATISAGLAGSSREERAASARILGSSVNEFRDGVVRTTMRLYQGATPLTIIEEKSEGDAKFMVRQLGLRKWMVSSLREWERVTGDRVFRAVTAGEETDQDIVEAWSSMAQAYFIGRNKDGEAVGWNRAKLAKALDTALAGSLTGYARLFNAVLKRAAMIEKAKADGTFDGDFEALLERSTGMSEQRRFERAVAREGEQVAAEVGATFSVVEDYGISHRPRDDGPRAFDLAEDDMMPADVYDHPEWYSGMEPKVIRETMAQLRKVRGNPEGELTIFRAGPVGEMNPGDWVTLSKEYAKTHGMGIDPGDSPKVWSAKVRAENVRWSMDDLSEFGYFGETIPAEDTGATFSILPSSETDARYLELAKDPEANRVELQQMVDDAARAAGYKHQGLFHGSSARFDRFMPEFLGSAAGGVSANEAFFLTDSERTARGYAVHAAEDGPVKRIMRDADLAEKRGDWDEQERLILLAEEMVYGEEGAAASAERRKNAVVYSLFARGNFLEVDAEGKSAEEFGSLTAMIRQARRKKLDGVIFRNLDDAPNLNDPATHFAIFSPNQIKSADPVTYDESGNVIPLSQRFDPTRDEITYSVLPSDGNLDDTFARMFSPFQRSPELRAKLGQEMQRRAVELGRDAAPILRANRTKGSIEAERKQRENDLFGEKLEALGGAFVSSLEGANLDDASARPILSELLQRKSYQRKDGKTVSYWGGSLMSKGEAKRRGIDTTGGEWDDIPEGLPGYVWGGGMSPDRAASMLGFDSVPEFWTALQSEIDSYKAIQRQAEEANQEISRLRKEAREESQAWADQALKDRATVGTDRATLLAFLRTLDAITRALPAEVRGKIGGYVALAKLKGPGAMLDEIESRVQAIDRELEIYLKKQADEALDALFEKVAKSRTQKAGEVGKGKATPEVYALIDELKTVRARWSAEEGRAEAEKIQGLIDTDGYTAEEIGLQMARAELIPLFAGWNGRTEERERNGKTVRVRISEGAGAAQRTAAVEALTEIWKKAKLEWVEEQARVRERRQAIREGGIAELRAFSTTRPRDEQENMDRSRKGLPRKFAYNIMSFDGFFRWFLGDDSLVYKAFTDGQRKAENEYTDAMQRINKGIEDFFTETFGGGSKLKGRQVAWRLSQKNVTIRPDVGEVRTMSQMEMVTAQLMWRQEDGKRHMRGIKDEEGNVISDWSYDEEFMKQVGAAMSDEAWKVLDMLTDLYAAEYEPINRVYRRMFGVDMPRHHLYAPLTVIPTNPGSDAIDPLTGFFTGGLSGVSGSFKTRGTSTVEPDFKDALSVFIAHTMQMEHFKAFGEFAREFRAITGNASFRKALKQAGGEQATATLSNLIEEISNGGIRNAGRFMAIEQTLDRVGGRIAQGILFGRLQTIALNITQLGAASVEMSPGVYLGQLRKLVTGQLNFPQALRTAYIQRRIAEMPPIIRQAIETGKGDFPNRLRELAEKIGYGISASDGFFTAATYVMTLDHQMSLGRKRGLDGPELERWARNETERIVDRLAQPTRKGARSVWENNATGAHRTLASFISEARKNTALLHFAFTKGGKEGMARTGGYLLFAAIFSELLRTGWRDLRDDEEGEDDWNLSAMIANAALDWTYGIPIFGGVIQDFVKAAVGEKTFSGTILESGNNAIPAARRLLSWDYSMDDIETTVSDLNKVLGAIGAAYQPASDAKVIGNVMEDAAKIIDNILTDP